MYNLINLHSNFFMGLNVYLMYKNTEAQSKYHAHGYAAHTARHGGKVWDKCLSPGFPEPSRSNHQLPGSLWELYCSGWTPLETNGSMAEPSVTPGICPLHLPLFNSLLPLPLSTGDSFLRWAQSKWVAMLASFCLKWRQKEVYSPLSVRGRSCPHNNLLISSSFTGFPSFPCYFPAFVLVLPGIAQILVSRPLSGRTLLQTVGPIRVLQPSAQLGHLTTPLLGS